MTVLITGGTVISPTGSTRTDVLVDGERIVALLEPGSSALGSELAASAERVIDATGKYVIPGGIDGHTHMQMPFGGTEASDTFETGTRAAAWGGTTTIVDFVVQAQGQRVQDSLAAWHAKALGECAIDYGFHQIVGGVDDDSLKAMDELIDEGITTFKLFMAYPGVFYSDDGQILRAMQAAAGNGSMIMMHAENGIAIDVLVQQALARGETDPVNHGLTRPWQTEEEATHRAIMLARITGAPLYIVHMSAKQAVATLAAHRGEGLNVFGETCPQYLYLSLEKNLGAPGFEGAKWVCSTPLRAEAEGHQDELWRYLRTNDLQVVSTDHCPFCMKEQKELGINDFSKIPNGIGSVEHRHGPAVPGRRGWADHQGAVGRAVLHDAGTDVRHVRPEGRDRPRCRRRHSRVRPERAHQHRRGQDPPHEHGLLRVGGLRDQRPRRHRHVARDRGRRRRRVRRAQGPRPVRQAGPVAVPVLKLRSAKWHVAPRTASQLGERELPCSSG